MNTPKTLAAAAFEAWAVPHEEIPTGTEEESDWLVTLEGGYRVLAEEKTKFEDPEDQAKRQATLDADGIHGQTIALSSNNRLSGIVRKSSSQLASSSKNVDHDARILWFTGTGYDAEAKHYQLISTLYGSTKVFERTGRVLRTCYFFRNADFYRFKEQLDGAVVAFLTGDTITMKLCLNPYSPRYETVRQSSLVGKFPNGLIDPLDDERAGHAYVADVDLPRSDTNAVLRHLEAKYDLHDLNFMDMNLATVAVQIKR